MMQCEYIIGNFFIQNSLCTGIQKAKNQSNQGVIYLSLDKPQQQLHLAP